ncbi:MarR family transcriptional regulator [Dactylosporangium sp. CA-139066]|uniref:MarR family transcriptional regulator n=1 Tax=Dactylosporangium sp. CA-139066 TaxID=3239930 RepID=UPI003D8A711F
MSARRRRRSGAGSDSLARQRPALARSQVDERAPAAPSGWPGRRTTRAGQRPGRHHRLAAARVACVARVADPSNQLSVAQLELLVCLAEHPGAQPGQLTRLLNLRTNTVTTLVNALTGLGIVRQLPGGAGDRRTVELGITGDGFRAVQPGKRPTAPCSTSPCPPCPLAGATPSPAHRRP